MTKTHDKRLVAKVLKLRDQKELSWLNIREAIAEGKTGVTVSASTVRRMYDEGKGVKGAHYDSRPLPGGRYRKVEDTPKRKSTTEKRTAKAAASKAKPKRTAQKSAAARASVAARKRPAKVKVQPETVTETVPPSENGSAPAKRTARKAVKANA